MVAWSTMTAPVSRCGSTRSTTDRDASSSSRHMNTARAPRTACSAWSTISTPNASSSRKSRRVRFQARTRCPARARFRAMGRPMAPRPRKATCAGPVSMPNSPPCRVEIYDTAPRAFPRGAASVRTVWAAALPAPAAGAARRRRPPGCRLAGQLLKHLLQVLLAAEAHVLLLGLAVAEDDQRGNAHAAVALGDVGALVDVELGELDLVAVLAGQF